MKHLLAFITLIITFSTLNAQVGIGTTSPDPTSILDITSADKGVLVPRVSLIDVSNLTIPINSPATGLLIWNTNASVTGGNGIGFYFFNSAQWMPIMQSQIEDADFYEVGTTTSPTNINSNVFRTGNLLLGNTTTTSNAKVVVENSESIKGMELINNNNYTSTSPFGNGLLHLTTNSDINLNYTSLFSALNINNTITKSGTGYTFSIGINTYLLGDNDANWANSRLLAGTNANSLIGSRNEFGNTSTNFQAIGTYNYFRTANDGGRTGIFNSFGSPAGFGNNVNERKGVENYFQRSNVNAFHYGIKNTFSSSANDSYGVYNDWSNAPMTSPGDKYGVLTLIPNNISGIHYGVFCDVTSNSGFAGYFLGRVAIGTNSVNNYILPSSRGTNNQIMQTDNVGNISWVDTSTFSSDNQNLIGANLTGSTLQIDIENGTSTSVDLSSLNQNHWSRTGTDLDVATAADDISFSSDQTSITFPITSGTPSSMIYMFNGGSSNSDRMVFSHSAAYSGWGLQYRDSNDSFRFLSAGADRVTINLAGGNPLVVNGSAQATNFISSTTTYPDYVFESYFDGTSELNEHYAFKPLNEVEAFIKKNGHLPGVHSYKAVRENNMSINLTETSIVNLEKIEELFLYAIELKKENTSLKENQKQLEERLLKIEALLLKNN